MNGVASTVVKCPKCTTKTEIRFLFEALRERQGLLQCREGCHAVFQQKSDGTLVDLEPTLEKIRLGDDLISAVSPDTIAGESILHAVDKFESNLKTVTLGFLGDIRNKMQMAEGRAHLIHGELARRAVADSSLDDYVTTAKQVVDLVSSRPDGIRKDGG